MDISADVNAIIEQAPEWNFAGDCALLALMKRISENLYNRGECTNGKLRDFDVNVKRTKIALDNTTNCLRSLQFGQQFVEYRVEDVDEDDFAMPDQKEMAPLEKSVKEMAHEFMQNNLKMFRKNFEEVTIEVPDSDEEDDEGAVNKTTIFRAKNPYDAIPLPYIIGTKEWQEHKYAGLYDSPDISENEQEEFSSSSSDEKPPTEDYTAKSEFVSQAVTKEENLIHSAKTNVHVPKQILSESVSRSITQPRPIFSSPGTNPREHDLFAALRHSPPSDDPPTTSSSSSISSSPRRIPPSGFHNIMPKADGSLSSSSSSASKIKALPAKVLKEEPLPNTSVILAAAQTLEREVPKTVMSNQIKRKPVNLFNDDDFNSLMSEIVEKVQTRTEDESSAPSVVENPSKLKPPSTAQAIRKTTVNLFDDSPPISPTISTNEAFLVASPKQSTNSVFDGDEFFSVLPTTKSTKLGEEKPKHSLFDDDDDFDIDDIFSKRPASQDKLKAKAIGKISLFGDDDNDDDVMDLFGDKRKSLPTKVQEPKPSVNVDTTSQKSNLFDDQRKDNVEQSQPKEKKNHLFDDVSDEGDEILFGNKQTMPKEQSKLQEHQYIEKEPSVIHDPILKKTDLFVDNPEDYDDFHNFIPDHKQTISKIKSNSESKTNLLDDITEDAGSEVFFSNKQPLPKEPFDERIIKIIESKTSEVVEESVQKNSNLFDDDIDDDDLLGIRKSIPILVQDSLEKEISQNDSLPIIPSTEMKIESVVDKNEYKIPVMQVIPIEKQSNKSGFIVDDAFKDVQKQQTNLTESSLSDPIVSMIADVSNKKPQNCVTNTPRKHSDIAVAEQIMQNYTNLFCDEPPDDSDFFRTLGSGSGLSSLSASKIFDTEQDFFEPVLPEIPTITSTADQQTPRSEYTGMHLFSDIPPDDDDDIVTEVGQTSTASRIHTIFYDDFSETARATESEQLNQNLASNFVDADPPSDVVDRSVIKPNEESIKVTPVINKLKLPNININVQALLPGAGLQKLPTKSPGIQDTSGTTSLTPTAEDNNKPSGQTSLLHSANKTRARGPANRRPSTRRARQKNYADSLQEQPPPSPPPITKKIQEPLLAVTGGKKPLPTDFFADNSNDDDDDLFANSSKLTHTDSKVTTPITVRTVNKTRTTASLFSDDDDDDDLFGGAGAAGDNKIKKSMAKQQIVNEIVPTKTITSDNPLADLLNP